MRQRTFALPSKPCTLFVWLATSISLCSGTEVDYLPASCRVNNSAPPSAQGQLKAVALAPKLTVLHAARNRFSGLPPAYYEPHGRVPAGLRVFDVADNLLAGRFPAALAGHERLEVLRLQDNYFK